MKRVTAILMTLLLAVSLVAQQAVPGNKETRLGLYLTAKEAYERWKTNPDEIKVLDVRTPEEYVFVGHAPMAINIPLLFMGTYNDSLQKFGMTKNEAFLEQVAERFAKTDTIFIMCRSGGRSAAACNILAEHGYTNAYNVIDGFEGDVLKDENSYFYGKRVVNGWKNAAPWTYELEPDKVYKKQF